MGQRAVWGTACILPITSSELVWVIDRARVPLQAHATNLHSHIKRSVLEIKKKGKMFNVQIPFEGKIQPCIHLYTQVQLFVLNAKPHNTHR